MDNALSLEDQTSIFQDAIHEALLEKTQCFSIHKNDKTRFFSAHLINPTWILSLLAAGAMIQLMGCDL